MNTSILTLTGETIPNRFVVEIGEARVSLPESRFLGLLVLIEAKRQKQSGKAELQDFSAASVVFDKTSLHQLIHRLRCDFQDALGEDAGRDLVLHEGMSRYSLAIDLDAIAVAPEFRELESDIPALLFRRVAGLIPAQPPSAANSESDLSASCA